MKTSIAATLAWMALTCAAYAQAPAPAAPLRPPRATSKASRSRRSATSPVSRTARSSAFDRGPSCRCSCEVASRPTPRPAAWATTAQSMAGCAVADAEQRQLSRRSSLSRFGVGGLRFPLPDDVEGRAVRAGRERAWRGQEGRHVLRSRQRCDRQPRAVRRRARHGSVGVRNQDDAGPRRRRGLAGVAEARSSISSTGTAACSHPIEGLSINRAGIGVGFRF